jgi:hypothetical protein
MPDERLTFVKRFNLKRWPPPGTWGHDAKVSFAYAKGERITNNRVWARTLGSPQRFGYSRHSSDTSRATECMPFSGTFAFPGSDHWSMGTTPMVERKVADVITVGNTP